MAEMRMFMRGGQYKDEPMHLRLASLVSLDLWVDLVSSPAKREEVKNEQDCKESTAGNNVCGPCESVLGNELRQLGASNCNLGINLGLEALVNQRDGEERNVGCEFPRAWRRRRGVEERRGFDRMCVCRKDWR